MKNLTLIIFASCSIVGCTNGYDPIAGTSATQLLNGNRVSQSTSEATNTSAGSTSSTATTVNWSAIPTDMPGLIRHFYACDLNRTPAQNEVDGWVQYFSSHRHSIAHIAVEFVQGAEYAARNRSKSDYITDLYHCLLFREPDVAGLGGGIAALTSTDYSSAPFVASTPQSTEYATVIAPQLPFVEPNWNGTIDVNQVVGAFADRHPHEAKKQTFYAFTGPGSTVTFNDSYKCERRANGVDYISVWVGSDNSSGAVYDWIGTDGTQVGFKGTVPTYPGLPATMWRSMIPFSPLFITTAYAGTTMSAAWDTYTGPNNADNFTLTAHNSARPTDTINFDFKNFGGSIGSRWIMTSTSVPGSANETQEVMTYDLGPAPGIWDPEFSVVAYRHQHKSGDPNPSDYTVEQFGQVVPDSLVLNSCHGSFFSYFTF